MVGDFNVLVIFVPGLSVSQCQVSSLYLSYSSSALSSGRPHLEGTITGQLLVRGTVTRVLSMGYSELEVPKLSVVSS